MGNYDVNMSTLLISICIPSYNRPETLLRLLQSVPVGMSWSFEIVIAEDASPRRSEIRAAVEGFRATSSYTVRYSENPTNLGYDGNLRNLAQLARGEFIIYMGDDDVFIPDNVPRFFEFVSEHTHLGFILRTYEMIHQDGVVEPFRYFPEQRMFAPGVDSFRVLFRRSVVISGFCFKKKLLTDCHTSSLDGTLLYQLYILAEVVRQSPSMYCEIPFVRIDERLREVPQFGAAVSESELYTPGEITVENSLNFMCGYIRVGQTLEQKYNSGVLQMMRREISKYSYPVMAIQRHRGALTFLAYCRKLQSKIGLGNTLYFYVYLVALLFLGKGICDRVIVTIKKTMHSTPRL